ncbi:MAG: 16S rRNA (cytosine(967)-C(5))-methyltransferase RsmB, partial [Bacillota bacterium]
KWQKKPQDITSLAKLQLELLSYSSQFLAEDGELVYSTCTIAPEENKEVIKQFVATNDQFRVVDLTKEAEQLGVDSSFVEQGMIQLLPTWQENEGYFIAKLRRKSK